MHKYVLCLLRILARRTAATGGETTCKYFGCNSFGEQRASVNGSLFTTAWRDLKLRMEETAYRYEVQLRSRAQHTKGHPPGKRLVVRLRTHYKISYYEILHRMKNTRVGHVARMGRREIQIRFSWESQKEIRQLGSPRHS